MKFKGNWHNSQKAFQQKCLSINELNNFKRDPVFSAIVGNDLRDFEVTKRFYLFVQQNYPELFNLLSKFVANDTLGDPKTHNFDGLNLSCATLRYIRVLGEIINFKGDSILEIGGGYGGQALITKIYNPDIRYIIIDLPEVCRLQQKYLKHFNVDVEIYESDNIPDLNFDIVLSDYCLSEFDSTGTSFYLDLIRKSNCKYGYFSINSTGSNRSFLIKELQKTFKQVKLDHENPKTSWHHNIFAITTN